MVEQVSSERFVPRDVCSVTSLEEMPLTVKEAPTEVISDQSQLERR